MLGLKLPTDPRWVNLTEKTLEEILTDHAYCEQKATSSCISLIQQYPDKEKVVEMVSPVVTEEWSHFRQVLAELKKRKLSLGHQRKDEYVNKILKHEKKDGSRDEKLMEKLLICALIEARSCERFRLLSIELEDEYMRKFYHEFMVSEAGHYRMFLDLAKEYMPDEKVKQRWSEWLEIEKGIMNELELRGDRIH
ncbi:MAG: tRNA-(ms[2]io[6]A)-hydroxylase [Bacteroidetes bacterium]|nr:tRNA-(ms[2]io[6]A)-hydroxylase [Bacteroidota bacterium]